jgi:pimeloyl-ACP methyl ester carboxylesterase
VDTSWGQLHYESVGSGEQTVLLIHETGLDHSAFKNLVPELSGRLRVVAFDTPGCGESDPPPAITTVEEYSKHLLEGINALGIDRLAVFGAHTGAQIAVQLAAVDIPDRVDAVFCLGLPFYRPEVLAKRRVAVVSEFTDDGAHLLTGFHRPPKEYHPEVRSRMVAATSLLPDRVFWPYHAVYKYAPGEALPKIKAPVVFISNEKDILRPGDEDGVELVADGRLVNIESDRLPLYWTQPGQVAQVVLSTLGSDGA